MTSFLRWKLTKKWKIVRPTLGQYLSMVWLGLFISIFIVILGNAIVLFVTESFDYNIKIRVTYVIIEYIVSTVLLTHYYVKQEQKHELERKLEIQKSKRDIQHMLELNYIPLPPSPCQLLYGYKGTTLPTSTQYILTEDDEYIPREEP